MHIYICIMYHAYVSSRLIINVDRQIFLLHLKNSKLCHKFTYISENTIHRKV